MSLSPLQEELVARAYARRYPRSVPYFHLPLNKRREIIAYFESRGVIVNHRFGVTGRIGAYSALRRFTLGEQVDWDEEEQEEEPPDIEPGEKPHTFDLNPATELAIKEQLKRLQTSWPDPNNETEEAREARDSLLDSAVEILTPIALIQAKSKIHQDYFNWQDAEDAAQMALISWKNKILKRVMEIQQGTMNAKGELLPDLFTGSYKGAKGGERNLVADIQTFTFNFFRNEYRKRKRHAEKLGHPVPIETSEEERLDGEGPAGIEPATHETPASQITGAEKSADIMAMFRSIARDLSRTPAYKREANLLLAMLDTNLWTVPELAAHLKLSRADVRRSKRILGDYLDRRSKTIPALKNLLRRVLRESTDSIRALCQKYSVLRFFFEGLFLPQPKPCPLLKIYEKYQSFE